MKILIVEDNQDKLKSIKSALDEINTHISITECGSIVDFVSIINRETFDLVVADLVLPVFGNETDDPKDVTSTLIEKIRDYESKNYKTPVIAITQYLDSAETNFSDLNRHDINVITYKPESHEWKSAFIRKVESCIPKLIYDFIIICALQKEADAFIEAGYIEDNSDVKFGLSFRYITIDEKKGLIIVPPRMGLVNSSIASARAIELFEPKIICMSGICAGIEGKADIYDIVIPSQCDQHDAGKWTSQGFVPESYSIPLSHETQTKIEQIITRQDFKKAIAENVSLSRTEMIGDSSKLNIKIYTAPTSSGSSVIADDTMLSQITAQHRKKTAFEMESYALYEAARQSPHQPIYFSAKAVVDNGDSNKGDEYHRVAALVSAKAVYELLRRLL
ncbi:response regulator [Vibrio metoecus]|uniref:phosphorylase family protein n=1 Tax=Vibrio metoecus TaxID=1481663 RepID=UPI0012AE134C|nr:response regulator [Vibrio metoecus]